MTNSETTPEGKDDALWTLAKKRTKFKTSLTTYLIFTVFFWLIWYFTDGHFSNGGVPWPVWAMAGWGIGIAFQYRDAYVVPSSNTTEREYEKLKNNQS